MARNIRDLFEGYDASKEATLRGIASQRILERYVIESDHPIARQYTARLPGDDPHPLTTPPSSKPINPLPNVPVMEMLSAYHAGEYDTLSSRTAVRDYLTWWRGYHAGDLTPLFSRKSVEKYDPPSSVYKPRPNGVKVP